MKSCADTLESIYYAGDLYCKSGILEVCDPWLCEPLCNDIEILTEEQETVLLRNCMAGYYDIYYMTEDGSDRVTDLFLCFHDTAHMARTHHDFSVKAISNGSYTESGIVYPILSHSICIVESSFRDNAEFCKSHLEKTAFYNASDCLRILNRSPYSAQTRDRLYAYLKKCCKNHRYAEGGELLRLTEHEPHWRGFLSSDIHSSHWAVDSFLRTQIHPVSPIHAGVVMGIPYATDYCMVSCLYGAYKKVRNIHIHRYCSGDNILT